MVAKQKKESALSIEDRLRILELEVSMLKLKISIVEQEKSLYQPPPGTWSPALPHTGSPYPWMQGTICTANNSATFEFNSATGVLKQTHNINLT